jgi:uncharacterized repeat protein (TIGR02543 family)
MGCVLGLVAGCKIAIIVPSGGDVVSSNAAHNCAEGNVCEFEINTGQLPFSETLTAIPKAGYVFEKWSDGKDFQCGKSTNPTCTINIADDSLASLAVSLFDSGYAMPIFKDVGFDTDGDGIFDRQDEDDDNDGVFDVDDLCPLDPNPNCGILIDNVVIGGKQWAQVKLFNGLTWEEVNAVCPNGNCISGETLNGWDMTGWKWASVDEIKQLFNSFIGSVALYPGVDTYSAPGGISLGAPSYLGLTWEPDGSTLCNPAPSDPIAYFHGFESGSQFFVCTYARANLSGHVRDDSGSEDSAAVAIISYDALYYNQNYVSVDYTAAGGGAWFYRTP